MQEAPLQFSKPWSENRRVWAVNRRAGIARNDHDKIFPAPALLVRRYNLADLPESGSGSEGYVKFFFSCLIFILVPAVNAQTSNRWYCEADTQDNKAVVAVFARPTVSDFNSESALVNSYGKSFLRYVKAKGYQYGGGFPTCGPVTVTDSQFEQELSKPSVIRVSWSPVGHDLLNQDAIYWCSVADVDHQVAYYSELFRALHVGDVTTYNVEFGLYIKRTYNPTGRLRNECHVPSQRPDLLDASVAGKNLEDDQSLHQNHHYEIVKTLWVSSKAKKGLED